MTGLRVRFCFHGELNDFLPPAKRDMSSNNSQGPTDTIKHVIESLGVPHTEFEQDHRQRADCGIIRTISEGDRIEVFPHGNRCFWTTLDLFWMFT